jgi:hypothetical protein
MPSSFKRVTKEALREIFNRGSYWERAQSGEFEEDIEQSDEISPRKRRKLGMLHGSVSQIVAYRLPNGQKIATVHQYVYPSGEIRGKPDPKYLLVDGVIYMPFLTASEALAAEAAAAEKTGSADT